MHFYSAHTFFWTAFLSNMNKNLYASQWKKKTNVYSEGTKDYGSRKFYKINNHRNICCLSTQFWSISPRHHFTRPSCFTINTGQYWLPNCFPTSHFWFLGLSFNMKYGSWVRKTINLGKLTMPCILDVSGMCLLCPVASALWRLNLLPLTR